VFGAGDWENLHEKFCPRPFGCQGERLKKQESQKFARKRKTKGEKKKSNRRQKGTTKLTGFNNKKVTDFRGKVKTEKTKKSKPDSGGNQTKKSKEGSPWPTNIWPILGGRSPVLKRL